MAECDNCGYDTQLEDYAYGSKVYGFCEICASTFLSRATTHPYQMEQKDVWLYRSLGYIANMLLNVVHQRGGEKENEWLL